MLRPRLSQLFAGSIAAALLFSAIGCNSMQRRMTVRTDPPGALLLVDGEEVGYTPASIDFTYYGTREITLIKDGYETMTAMHEFKAPIYQQPGVDFVTDNLLPMKVTDRHDLKYRLQPRTLMPTDQLIDRADSFRSRSLFDN
ncbi:PEGA domain-containing protein [Calycomorphotria hydatis]|uniref:PEGA domain protein n=1 Tax=Calycomorphotria hydatis TaxID=2528027 RepID=A0A517TAR1_9PLAN|nr:PEGA domain-containing protein [Calycomorphotria hydatis]QDT65459.1 PEGA domain protein [Calycomorphotria hydatis]